MRGRSVRHQLGNADYQSSEQGKSEMTSYGLNQFKKVTQ